MTGNVLTQYRKNLSVVVCCPLFSGFCVIGNFTDHVPDKKALTTMQQLIKCGQDNGKLTNDYTLRGHRDVGHTECPGQSFYDLIRTWPHYWKQQELNSNSNIIVNIFVIRLCLAELHTCSSSYHMVQWNSTDLLI